MKTAALLAFTLLLSLDVLAQQAYAELPFGTAAARAGSVYQIFPSSDHDPENKELSVVAGVLLKLIQQEFNQGDTAINIERVKGSYIPGSGVLFTITQRMPFYNRPMLLGVNGRTYSANGFGLATTIPPSDVAVLNGQRYRQLDRKVQGTTRATSPRSSTRNPNEQLSGQGVLVPGVIEITGDSVEMAFSNGLLHEITTDGSFSFYEKNASTYAKLQDSVFAAKLPRMKKVLEKFLAEYTILLNNLKPAEKIWVTWSIKEDHWGINQGRTACELSSRILKQDMLDLRSGKLSKADFSGKILHAVTRCAERVTNPEVEVFTAILERLYAADVSQSLVQFGAIQGEAIGGFGYVFKLNFIPQRNGGLTFREVEMGQGVYALRPQHQEISKEQLEEKYTQFKREFPQQMLEYSRVLKGLKAGEILKIDVSLGTSVNVLDTRSQDSSKRLSYALPQTVIQDYDTGKLKLEDALKLIQIDEK